MSESRAKLVCNRASAAADHVAPIGTEGRRRHEAGGVLSKSWDVQRILFYDKGRSRKMIRGAIAYVRAHRVTHARIEPSSVLNHGCSDAHDPLDDGRIARREHGWPTLTRPQNDR